MIALTMVAEEALDRRPVTCLQSIFQNIIRIRVLAVIDTSAQSWHSFHQRNIQSRLRQDIGCHASAVSAANDADVVSCLGHLARSITHPRVRESSGCGKTWGLPPRPLGSD